MSKYPNVLIKTLLKKGRDIFNWQEKILKKIQFWYMPKKLKNESHQNNNKVIINDKMLKFHLSDKREEDFKKWKEKCRFY